MELTIGADPELFVKKGTRFISGHVFDFGSKTEPKETKHGSVQVDGLALEFNVRPAHKKADFIRNIKGVLGDLEALVRTQDAECSLHAVPTVHFGSEYISGLPLHVRTLGCNPDFSAYTGDVNEKPDGEVPFRTGAGHVHLGWTYNAYSMEHLERCCELVRELDYYLGLPSLDWDKDYERRSLYGKAGTFRPKLYGLEYRVLSNAWVMNDELAGFIFTQSKKAFTNWSKNQLLFKRFGTFAKDCIDNNIRDWKTKHPGLEAML